MESKIHPAEYSYFEIKRIISGLITKYPFIGLSSIGRSVAGRDINALTIGAGDDYSIFLSGADPQFRLGTLLLLMFTEELCESIISGKQFCSMNMRKALFGKGIIIVPQLNPDGAEITQRGETGCGYMSGKISTMCGGEYSKWRANMRGVEIRHNFDYIFDERRKIESAAGIDKPIYYGFSGYKPESEPETVAFSELCRKTNVRNLLEISSPGNTVIYSGSDNPPKHSAKMAEVMSAVTGFTVTPPIGKRNDEICDWYTSCFNKPGFNVKIGENTIPQVSALDTWYARIKEMLVLFSLF